MGPSFGPGTSLIGAPAAQVLGQPSALAQQGPNSAGFQPNLIPPPAGMPPGIQYQQRPPQSMQQFAQNAQQPQMGTQATVGLPPTNGEAQMILQALSSRLKSLSKVDEARHIPPTPNMSQFAQGAEQQILNGGGVQQPQR